MDFCIYSWRVTYLAPEAITRSAHGLLFVHALPGLIVVCRLGATNLSFCRDLMPIFQRRQRARDHTVFIVRQNNNFFVNLLHHGQRSYSSVFVYFNIYNGYSCNSTMRLQQVCSVAPCVDTQWCYRQEARTVGG
jgi:hypothetical protein